MDHGIFLGRYEADVKEALRIITMKSKLMETNILKGNWSTMVRSHCTHVHTPPLRRKAPAWVTSNKAFQKNDKHVQH